MSTSQSEPFEGWAIVELMGHRRLAGFVRDVELFGGRRLRIDVPKAGEPTGSSVFHATQFYGAAALYCVTPTDEDTARRVAATTQPAPVQAWELPQLPAKSEEPDEGEEPQQW